MLLTLLAGCVDRPANNPNETTTYALSDVMLAGALQVLLYGIQCIWAFSVSEPE